MPYPSALDNLPTSYADATAAPTQHAAAHNNPNAAINAVEAELGLLPKGSFSTVVARLNARTSVRKSADQTFTSTVTPANVTDLVFPVVAGNDYRFWFEIAYNSNLVTNGIRLALTCPALTGYLAARVSIWGRAAPTAGTQAAATANLATYEGFITASGGVVASDAVAVINTNYIAIISGILSNPSANGNLQVQAANEVSQANGNIVKKGSYGEMYLN